MQIKKPRILKVILTISLSINAITILALWSIKHHQHLKHLEYVELQSNMENKINQLEQQIISLHIDFQELKQLQVQTPVQEGGKELSRSTSAEKASSYSTLETNSSDDPSDELKAGRAEDLSLTKMENEKYKNWSDEEWLVDREIKITEFLQSNQYPNIHLRDVVCQQTVCRIAVKEDMTTGGPGLETLIDTDEIGQGVYFYTDAEGLTVAYIVRDKEAYAQVDLQELEKSFKEGE